MMLGYAGTRDRLSVSSVGTGGVEEMKERLVSPAARSRRLSSCYGVVDTG